MQMRPCVESRRRCVPGDLLPGIAIDTERLIRYAFCGFRPSPVVRASFLGHSHALQAARTLSRR